MILGNSCLDFRACEAVSEEKGSIQNKDMSSHSVVGFYVIETIACLFGSYYI